LVAEKPGALEVVARRLRDCGLDDLCLTLHEKETASKKGFSKSLQSTVERLEQHSETRISESFFESLKGDRQTLNTHAEQLHHYWEPIEKSAFDLYGELLKLKRAGIPDLQFTIRTIKDWSVARLQEAKTQLETLGLFVRFFRGQQTTVWAKSRLMYLSSEIRVELKEEIADLHRGTNLAYETATRVQELLNLQIPDSLEDIESLHATLAYLEAPFPLPKDWPHQALENLQSLYSELREKDLDFHRHYQALQEKYTCDLIRKNDIPELLQRFRKKYRSMSRLLQKSYWKTHKAVFACRKEQERLSFWYSYLFGYRQLVADLQQATDCINLRQDLSSPTYSVFSPFCKENKFNFEAIEISLDWIEGLQNYPIQKKQIANVISSQERLTELAELRDDLQNARDLTLKGLEFLRQCFSEVERVVTASNTPLEQASLSIIKNFLDTAENELGAFGDWMECQKCITTLKEMGAGTFVESLRTSGITPDLWFITLQQAVYQQWLDRIYDEFSGLKNFSAQLHERRIEEFSQRDREQYSMSQQRLRKLHANQWQAWSQQSGAREKISLLKRESQQQRPRKSIRQFIKETEDLVAALKPCWMMSPLAVSEHIDPETPQFDTVIFDEASQIRTEEAVSAIMRAKQAIVVGDDKQLPPTFSFIKYDTDEDEDSTAEEVYESLLVECGKLSIPAFKLRWHYRSQDESLIAFSNEHFYDSKLITFPNPIKDTSRGVHFHYVEDGIYDRGGSKPINLREAEEVAKLALLHAQTSKQSLGLIAFSKNQADAIQKELDRLGSNNSELADLQEDSNKFFLRHLENVQGEERDVIILSFCYGRDLEGQMGHNFGPLNKSGGDRRLNVAITRAKQKLILVASIRGSDLEPEGKSSVIKKLQDYLNYVERNNAQIDDQAEEPTTLPELHPNAGVIEDIYIALQQAGYNVCPSVGRSKFPIDLAVFDNQRPHEFLLGIEVDGKTYQAYDTARDRDRLRRKVLEEDLKWQIHRIWSKEWFHNRNVQLNQLIEKLENIKEQRS
jgi:REase_MTES_1575/AAA domain